jgi:hypothetical protein
MITFVPNPSAVTSTMRKAPDVLLRSVAIANHRLKTAATIGRRNGNGDPGAHALGLFRQEETASRL